MKYEKLIFIYPFSIGSFLNAKVGIEATIEEGDNYLDCFHKLRRDVKEMADIEQGNIYDAPPASNIESDEYGQWSKSPIRKGEYTLHSAIATLDALEKAEPNNGNSNTIGITVESIKSCQQLMTLEKVYFPLIDKMKDKEKKDELWAAYDERYAQLKNQSK